MTSKLRVKLGRIELEFEGTEEFIKQELMTILTQVKTLSSALSESSGGDDADHEDDNKGGGGALKKSLTTSTIAAALNVATATDLVVAALAKLCLVDDLAQVSRKQLTGEMRNATAYFKETYIKNLSNALRTLVTGKRINDLGASNYSLAAGERTSLGKKLANAG